MVFNYKITSNIKLIDYLDSYFLSKSKIYTLFLEKKILVNDHPCKKEDMLKKNDVITIIDDGTLDFRPQKYKLDIIYEDDYLLIINKPCGVIVHPDNKDGLNTLCNYVAYYYKENGIDIPVRYAHRLDTDTTGIIVFCKDMLSMSYMNHYISTHEVKRGYLALIEGQMGKKEGTINLPIGRDRHVNGKRRVSPNGNEAITNYKVLKSYGKYSLVSIFLQTGRTHQIRVHFSHLKHPLLGDILYGAKDFYIDRVALHSSEIIFVHPVTKETMHILCDLPKDMKILCK